MGNFVYTIDNGSLEPVSLTLNDNLFTHYVMASCLSHGMLYEPESTDILLKVLKKGSTFVDVGAHIGWFSLIASRIVGESGLVYSFEPDRSNFSRFLEHIEANKAENIVPIFMAVDSKPGRRNFHINLDNDGGHALYDPGMFQCNEKTREHPKSAKVMATSLDSFFDHHSKVWPEIDLLKIDTEGAEVEVLEGAYGLLSQGKIHNILAEINIPGLSQMGDTEAEMRELMDELGYRAIDIGKTDNPNEIYNVLFTLN